MWMCWPSKGRDLKLCIHASIIRHLSSVILQKSGGPFSPCSDSVRQTQLRDAFTKRESALGPETGQKRIVLTDPWRRPLYIQDNKLYTYTYAG